MPTPPPTDVNRQLEKVKRDAKELAKKNQEANVRTMALHIVRGRNTVLRLEVAKAQINSISMQLNEQSGACAGMRVCAPSLRATQPHPRSLNSAAMMTISGVFRDATGIMKHTAALMKCPEVMSTINKFSQQMQEAGIIRGASGCA